MCVCITASNSSSTCIAASNSIVHACSSTTTTTHVIVISTFAVELSSTGTHHLYSNIVVQLMWRSLASLPCITPLAYDDGALL